MMAANAIFEIAGYVRPQLNNDQFSPNLKPNTRLTCSNERNKMRELYNVLKMADTANFEVHLLCHYLA
jgi:hypothetical protein